MKSLVCIVGIVLAFWITDITVAQKAKRILWGDPWLPWTKCSKTCGGGISERVRYCTTPDVVESRCIRRRTKVCNRRRCPTPKPGETPAPDPTDPPSPVQTTTVEPSPEPTDTPSPVPEMTDPPDAPETPEPTSIPEPTDTPEAMPEYTDAPDAPETPEPTSLPEPTDTPEAMPEYTDAPDAPETPKAMPEFTDAPETMPEFTDAPETPDTMPEFTDAPETPETMPEFTDAPETPKAMPEFTDAPETPKAMPEYTDSPPSPEMTDAPKPMPETDGPMPWPEGVDPKDTDYAMAPWGDWSSCSADCGGGVKYRTRECENPTGRPECESVDATECNTDPCEDGAPVGEPTATSYIDPDPEQEPIIPDGPMTWPEGGGKPDDKGYVMAPWGRWSSCSMACGGGVRYRTRKCEKPNGRPECEEADAEECNTDPCEDGTPVGEPPPVDTSLLGQGVDPDGQTLTGVVPWPQGEPPMKDKDPEPSSYVVTIPTSTPEDKGPTPSSVVVTEEPKSTYAATSRMQAEKDDQMLKEMCGSSSITASSNIVKTAVSPGYPDKYPGGLDCMWVISASAFRRVKIIIKNFNLANGDKLTLLEGRPREIPYSKAKIATLTGNVESGTEYMSMGRYMTIRLQTADYSSGGTYEFGFTGSRKRSDEDGGETGSPDTPDTPKAELWYGMLRIFARWLNQFAQYNG